MENFSLLFGGFQTAMSLTNLIAAIIGSFLGIIVGAMPGMGSLTGVALLLPLTFGLEPTTGIIMLCALYFSNMYGGSFSAILINIPGDSPAIMTAIDGYQLTKQGKAAKALSASNVSSFIGGAIGIVMLTFLGPALAKIGLKFGPAEMVSLLLFALTSISWMLGDNPKKGILSTCLGILLALVGLDPTRGQPRLNFGNTNLLGGISFVPLVIGMFGFSQVMNMMINRQEFSFLGGNQLTFKESILTKNEIKEILPVSLSGGLIGSCIGILPGAGATIASFISYMFNKRICKDGNEFGKGSLKGVAAAETANNAAAAGAFAPLLSLGIPGSGTAAILLGGLMMWGLKPGPLLFVEEPDFVWSLIGSMYISNVIGILISIALLPFIVKILKVPCGVMATIIMVLCVVGSYTVNNNIFDVYVMIIAGVIACILKKKNYPEAPLLLAFVLTPQIEKSFVQAFQISRGSPSIFFTKPISLALLILIVAFIIIPIIFNKVSKKKETA